MENVKRESEMKRVVKMIESVCFSRVFGYKMKTGIILKYAVHAFDP